MNETTYFKIVNNENGTYTFTVSENITSAPVIDHLTATLPNSNTAVIYFNGLTTSIKETGYKLEALDQDTVIVLMEMIATAVKTALGK